MGITGGTGAAYGGFIRTGTALCTGATYMGCARTACACGSYGYSNPMGYQTAECKL